MADFISNIKNFLIGGVQSEGNNSATVQKKENKADFLFEFVEVEEQTELDILLNGIPKKSNSIVENLANGSEKITGKDSNGKTTYVVENNAKSLSYPCIMSWSDNEAVISFDSKTNSLQVKNNEKAVINQDGTVSYFKNGETMQFDKKGNILE